MQYGFLKENFPKLICARCNKGTLKIEHKLASIEPEFSKSEHNHPDFGPDWIRTRIVTHLICDSKHCGEITSFYAEGHIWRCEDETGKETWEWAESFHIKNIYPSPRLISLPIDLFQDVKESLLVSFNVYWIDKALCANALRRSLEQLITHLSIPTHKNKKKMSLGNRLKELEVQKPKDAEFVKAVKPLTDHGSHNPDVDEKQLLNVLEAYEIYLDLLFDDKHERLEKLKKALADNAGKAQQL